MADEPSKGGWKGWANSIPVPDAEKAAAEKGDPSLRHYEAAPQLPAIERIANDVAVIKGILVAAAVIWAIGFLAVFIAVQGQSS